MKKHKLIIIGAGFAGICIAIKLKQQGIDDFLILEKADSLGGTWRENTYPGAECDVPSMLYSFSFEHNPDWKYKWSEQKQILKYQQDIAAKHQLEKYIQFNTTVSDAQYDTANNGWQITCSDGKQHWVQHLISAVGQLHYPSTPKIAGTERYQGTIFHSAKWDHHIEFNGKRVGVIGNAASAVQFVPKIAPFVQHLSVFQRSANWIIPKVDRRYTRFERWLSKNVPLLAKLYRFTIWLSGEFAVLPVIRGNKFSRWLFTTWCRRHLQQNIQDPELVAKLTPDYPIGAKRILCSDHYYPALTRDNVALITDKIEAIEENGIRMPDGSLKELDIIIYATGFKTNPFLSSLKITGKSGQLLSETWRNGAFAYLGVATHGFPNFHMMYGPNTNLGHNSIILMLETQANYIAQSIAELDRRSANSLEVKTENEQSYNEELQARLQNLVFNKITNSWYMDNGKITHNWAGGTPEYMRRLKAVDWSAYQLVE